MLAKLVPLFIIVPLVELALLIQIGKWLGVWETIGLCIVTGILGAFLVQVEGLRIWAKLQAELIQQKMPANQLIDGVLILIGGLLLLTPGIITDFIGFTLLLPFTRPLYRNYLKKKFERRMRGVGYVYHQSQRKQAEVKVVEKIED
ncbi:FxsA family protein [Patescibacteria group bacterium]|nr:FxsA family protein [Patescibacteria group bacterium]